jgi:hypothetical protein
MLKLPIKPIPETAADRHRLSLSALIAAALEE